MTKASRSQRLLAREAMLATLSHEIRTPLNGVLGMAGLLAETRLDAAQSAYLKTLRECGEHLLGLVNDALDYAKLEAGRVELEPIATDVETLLQGVSELLSPRAHAGGVEIAWAMVGNVPQVLADDGRLRQILFNLAGNAVKLTRSGGVTLTVRVVSQTRKQGRASTRLRFVVADTGPGLSETDQARIFEEFVQTKAGEAAGGAGLGLAIVQRLVRAFDGDVGVDSRPGEGAAFWFEADFDLATPATPFVDAAARVSIVDSKLIAVVSPSPVVRDAAILQIEAAGGVGIGCVSATEIPLNAAAALIDGKAFAPRARLKPPKGVPALILLAPEERRRIAAARAAGFEGYLIKPLRRASVAARLAAVLGEEDARAFVSGPAPGAEVEDERAVAPSARGARVLLAEDNPVNALLARALLVHAGCIVDRAVSGEEAVRAALSASERTPYDLILMDLRMPDLDGLSAARALRSAGVLSPIVALTANAFDEDRRACFEAGMNDFLTKPLDHRALTAVLARWAGPRAGSKAA